MTPYDFTEEEPDEDEADREFRYTNCQVCGRSLRDEHEYGMGMCGVCTYLEYRILSRVEWLPIPNVLGTNVNKDQSP